MDLFGELDFICELFKKNQDTDKFDCFFLFSLCFILGYESGYILHRHFLSQQIVGTLI